MFDFGKLRHVALSLFVWCYDMMDVSNCSVVCTMSVCSCGRSVMLW